MKNTLKKLFGALAFLTLLSAPAGENLFDSAKIIPGKYGTWNAETKTVRVSIPHGTKVSNATEGVRFVPDNAKFAGKTVKFSFKIKTEDVRSVGGKNFHNAKLLLAGATKNDPYWRGSKGFTGTNDWTEVVWRISFYGDNIRLAAIFGLQFATGTAEFKDIRAEVCDPFEAFRLKESSPRISSANTPPPSATPPVSAEWSRNITFSMIRRHSTRSKNGTSTSSGSGSAPKEQI